MSGFRKLYDHEADEIRRVREPFDGKRVPPGHPCGLRALADRFKVSEATISAIARGKHYREVDTDNLTEVDFRRPMDPRNQRGESGKIKDN